MEKDEETEELIKIFDTSIKTTVRQAHGPEGSRRAVRRAHGPEQSRRTEKKLK